MPDKKPDYWKLISGHVRRCHPHTMDDETVANILLELINDRIKANESKCDACIDGWMENYHGDGSVRKRWKCEKCS